MILSTIRKLLKQEKETGSIEPRYQGKKPSITDAQEQERKDVVEKWKDWVEQQGKFDSSKCVFLDESGVNIVLTRRYSRAKGAERVHDKVPLNTSKNTTILSSVRLDGETVYTHFQGPLPGDRFLSLGSSIANLSPFV